MNSSQMSPKDISGVSGVKAASTEQLNDDDVVIGNKR